MSENTHRCPFCGHSEFDYCGPSEHGVRAVCETCGAMGPWRIEGEAEALAAFCEPRGLAEAWAEVERLRMRLVACMTVAGANTPEAAAKVRDMHPDYRDVAVMEIEAAVDREMELRAEVERVTRAGTSAEVLMEATAKELREARAEVERLRAAPIDRARLVEAVRTAWDGPEGTDLSITCNTQTLGLFSDAILRHLGAGRQLVSNSYKFKTERKEQ